MRKEPTYTELLEELYHAEQWRKEPNTEMSYRKVLLCEIEAKEYVLKNINKYCLPEIEIADYIKNLNNYKDKLKRIDEHENY